MKDRKELLREVRQKEYDRLNNLTFSELESECCSWFNEDIRIYDNASADQY